MGFGSYEVILRDGAKIQAGYLVADTCNDNRCDRQINRGLDYLCGETPGGDEIGCGRYFCGSHLFSFPMWLFSTLKNREGMVKLCWTCLEVHVEASP